MKTDIRRSWKSEASCIEVSEITLSTPVFELQTIMWRRLQAYIYKLELIISSECVLAALRGI